MSDSSNHSDHLRISPFSSPTGLKTNPQLIKDEVYNMLLKIPLGKVSTYGDIAKALGHPKAARLIGQILHDNPNPIVVPCHRVVHSNGKIGGYAYGREKKRKLLEEEGVKFCGFNNTDLDEFQKCRVTWSMS
jgi:methylated-DNA-[protein]-cysteine S-methyltransferase